MSQSTIAKHYTRIIALWPKDALRPHLPFTRTIERRALPYGVKPTFPPADNAKKPSSSPATLPKTQTQTDLAQINALYSLLENRYSKKHAISAEALKPKSNPEHYERLMEEIERAPKKTWLQAKWDEWKMKIRFQ